jgi:predicted RNA binding protein YcfA (HicA-like mRNA interferase family)
MGERLPRVTAVEALRVLKRAGWQELRQSGSHVQLGHPDRPGMRVTVARHSGTILHPKTLSTILQQAGMTVARFKELL